MKYGIIFLWNSYLFKSCFGSQNGKCWNSKTRI